jgi:formylglycine-generating enzyme required for sulfatase activity
MGVVYKAHHLALKRTVALKMVLAGGHAGPEELARFRIEAQAVARLQHPNIVQIHEVGEAEGHPYCALEFVEEGNLADKIHGKPMPSGEAARLVETLARAMQLAHSRNVVHRDLKPANILLASGVSNNPGSGRPGSLLTPLAGLVPKITDFGLARQMDSESGETQVGQVMGTPSYMAPEQASGGAHEAGPAADVYALGAILYECLTGRPPFMGKTTVETLDQVRTQEPVPPSRWQKNMPPDLETICLKCLRKEPEKRYASAAELADDLSRYQHGEPILARPVRGLERAVKWVKRNPVVTVLAATVVLALFGGAMVSYLKYRDAEEQKGIAEQEAENAKKSADQATRASTFLKSIFRIAETDALGGNITARQILADAEKRIPVEFANEPELRAELEKAIVEVRRSLARRSPQAMILEVRGPVQWQSSSGNRKAAVPQMLLNLDDRLTLAADAQVQLIFLSDLHKERLRSGREAVIDMKGVKPTDAVLERDDRVPMTFARLPKGTFYMGGGRGQPGNQTEIDEDFEIAIHDVTQGQWEALMGKNPCHFSRMGEGRNSVVNISDEELKLFPVEMVSWDEVQEFIKRLNEKERGRGYLYRLPTSAEWEYACRGGVTSKEDCSHDFYFDRPTDVLTSELANFNGNTSPPGKPPNGKFVGRPTRVGAYPPNRLGMCDMHGNVCQWCADHFPGDKVARVVRGSCWGDTVHNCQARYRFGAWPNHRAHHYGFRLARVVARDPSEPTLVQRFPALLRGEDKPSDDAERLAFAQLAYDQQKFAVAARLWAEALTGVTKPSLKRQARLRLSAARAAALGALGQGKDEPLPDESAKGTLRRQTLGWLRAELAECIVKPRTAQALRQWMADPALAGVRDRAALDKLPEDEQKAFTQTWAAVAALLKETAPTREQARRNAACGAWDLAVACYAGIVDIEPFFDGEVGFEYAAVLLLSGDNLGYREHCGLFLQRSGQGSVRPYHVARACTLAPNSVKDPALPGRRAEGELSQHMRAFWALTIQGGLAYRAGRYNEAASLLERSLQADGKPGRAVLNWLWLSLVEHRRGTPAQARAWLEKATKWFEEYPRGIPLMPDDSKGMHLHNWLEAQVLRRESEALLVPNR